jgi:hypothetical protein
MDFPLLTILTNLTIGILLAICIALYALLREQQFRLRQAWLNALDAAKALGLIDQAMSSIQTEDRITMTVTTGKDEEIRHGAFITDPILHELRVIANKYAERVYALVPYKAYEAWRNLNAPAPTQEQRQNAPDA